MQVTVKPFSGLHMLQPNGCSTLDSITLLFCFPRHRFNNLSKQNNCSITPPYLTKTLDKTSYHTIARIFKVWDDAYPIAIGINDAWKTSNWLLTTTGSIRHIVRMQSKFSFLVHQLNRTSISNLSISEHHSHNPPNLWEIKTKSTD